MAERSLTATSECELVQAAQAGDRRAWVALFAQHRATVLAVSSRLTADPDLAEDIVQEAFVRAMRHRKSLRDAEAFQTWLLRIAVRLSLTHRGDRGQEGQPLADPVEAETPEMVVERRERWRQVELALRRVPPRHRALLILRDVQDLSYREMAEVLGCSVNAVKVRLSRARELFRQRAQNLLDWEVDDR